MVNMKLLAALFLAIPAAAAAGDQPRTYLLSIVNLPTADTQSVNAFKIATWGVEFVSVCRIPAGWRITAGSSLTPNGELKGEGSQGVTWFNRRNPSALRSLVLVRLSGPVQREDIREGTGVVPVTFQGDATVSTDDGDRHVPLNYRNIVLTRASACPDTLRSRAPHLIGQLGSSRKSR